MADVDCEEAAEIENISDKIISDDIIDNLDNNNENSSTNINNNEINQIKVQNKSSTGATASTTATNETKNQRKRKRYLSQQQQRKNNKNWKMNKLRRQQSENIDLDAAVAKANNFNNFDKNSQKLNPSIKFYKNLKLCRHRSFSAFSKFFLPEKRPRKDLIVPPTKFLLGGNISDPLNLKNIQNEGGLAPTPKSSPITTPPKIEVIIPPNIHDPLHLLDPVDAIEYQKQLTSPIKRKRKTKHRNRHRKKKASECQGNNNESGSIPENVSLITSIKDEASNLPESNEVLPERVEEEIATVDNNSSTEEVKMIDRERAIRDLRLEFHEGGGRKRKISESHLNSKVKVRRMESMDKIVSPVIPQPGAWKRVVHPTSSGAPRCGGRNRTRTQSASLSEDISPSEEHKKDGFGQQLIIATSVPTAQSMIEMDKQSVFEENVNKPVETSRDDSTKVQKPQFKNRDAKYQYGNYDRYHGYRNLNEFMDVRLKVFMRYPHLFEDNDILDIGCNAGHITIFVAKNLHPKTITGIDIDPTLIAKSRQNLALYVKIPAATVTSNESIDEGDDIKPTTSGDAQQKQRQQKLKRKKKVKMTDSVSRSYDSRQNEQCDEFFPISFPKCYGQIPQSPSTSNDAPQSVKEEPILFPKNIFFKTNNYVLKDDAMLNQDSQQYDLILCLSVTKWIHLNFGDAGLKLTFKRIFNQLRPGGKLVLEAQNWASYKKKKKLTENIFNNFKNIEFYPNKFHEYLLGPEVGFSHSYPLGVPRHLNKGFRRPIQLYIKGDFTPSQKHWSDTYYPQTPYAHRGIYAEPLYMGQTMPGSKSMWGNDTPHGNYSYRFTPSQNFSATSQYYNPYETDSYLPSYNQEIQTRQYCFQSPLYLTIWSPPSGRNSQSHTPLYGSIRDTDSNDVGGGGGGKKHVYLPTDGLDDVGKSSNRSSENDVEKSPQVQHVYVNTYNDSSSGTDTNSNQKCDSTTTATTLTVSQDKSTNSNDN